MVELLTGIKAHPHVALHLLADVFTYAGGFVLAKEVWDHMEEFVQAVIIEELGRGRHGSTVFVVQGNEASTREEVDLIHLRGARKKVAIGFALVTFGFMLSVLARLLELLH